MKTQKYSVNQHLIETVLAWVKSGEIAIPEIQRPFVWDATKVRDLMDSLYQGYPVGYIIAWRNPNVKLKDGSQSAGKKILIDGQQRVTALTAAILGQPVVNQDYRKVKIKIAFNPMDENGKFEVFNTAIAKDSVWIPDISEIFSSSVDLYDFVEDYCKRNPNAVNREIFKKFDHLKKIISKQIGLIELDSDLDIETVTEIFIRINSKGVALSQADFAMSKISVNEQYNGPILRKCIDYFCHLAIAPEFWTQIKETDHDFAASPYFHKISWMSKEKDDLYDPDYTDLLRVAFTSQFNRGKLADLVSLLSGRNFETRTYEDEIAKQSFEKLEQGIVSFVNENNFKSFIMIIKSAGFISPDLIRSKNAINFAYILYLKLKRLGHNPADIESYVRRWFVMSILTGRYSGSPESSFDYDIRQIASRPFKEVIEAEEAGRLSSAFWEVTLVQQLETSVASSPYFNVFLAAQVKGADKGFLSKDITVADMINHKGDIHHIFPRDYLKKNGLSKIQYNQIANYVYMQSEINIKVGNKPPSQYLREVEQQCTTGMLKYGGIQDRNELLANLETSCVPPDIMTMSLQDYPDFLKQRRILMAKKIQKYYFNL